MTDAVGNVYTAVYVVLVVDVVVFFALERLARRSCNFFGTFQRFSSL